MYALYIQLCTTRTEDEAKLIFENILQVNLKFIFSIIYSYLCLYRLSILLLFLMNCAKKILENLYLTKRHLMNDSFFFQYYSDVKFFYDLFVYF